MEQFLVNGKAYTKIKLLGHGKGGYSYLVQDGTKQYVLKKIHHEPCAYYQFGNKIEAERNDYNRLLGTGITIPRMIDIDLENEIIIKEYINGPTIDEIILRGEMKEEYLMQVKDMCKKLYSCNLNIDYFPTNFVAQDGLLYYIDYECNVYMEEWNFENWGVKYWSMTPEFIQHFHQNKKD